MTGIKTRKPTGEPSWPLVLVEGPEKSGKTYAAAQFTASERIGQAYWLDLGEGTADEYAAVPGADYLVLEHDGTWSSFLSQVAAVHKEAGRALAAGEKPVVLVIDSMSNEWRLLKDWVSARAKSSHYARKELEKDPDAVIKIAPNYWNDANERHAVLMQLLTTFPGIVVITAKGKETALFDDSGKPVPGKTDYRVEGQANLAYEVSAWVRLSREESPKIIGVRAAKYDRRPGTYKPQPLPDFTIEWLVFDVIKPTEKSQTRNTPVLTQEATPKADEQKSEVA